MEAICGGLGEIAQICVLYPLETIKVGCFAWSSCACFEQGCGLVTGRRGRVAAPHCVHAWQWC